MASLETDLIDSQNDDCKLNIKKVASKWKSHNFTADISNSTYIFRILKMNESLFIYIGQSENESFDELVVSMPIKDMSTTIIGSQIDGESKELAQQLSKRLKKQIFLSYNCSSLNTIRPLIVKRISDEIKNNPDAF